jgi:NADH-quinone oxidoreductase subunit J
VMFSGVNYTMFIYSSLGLTTSLLIFSSSAVTIPISSIRATIKDAFTTFFAPIFALPELMTGSLVTSIYTNGTIAIVAFVSIVGFICAFGVPSFANPVYSLVALIGCFFVISVALIASGAEFLGYLFLIVYIGAIAILFLFVIMLLDVRKLTMTRARVKLSKFKLAFLGVCLSITIKFIMSVLASLETVTVKITQPIITAQIFNEVNFEFLDILLFASFLYTEFVGLFILATLLLLSAMIGSIVIATNSSEQA